jgi:hypothetical protein
MISIFSCEHDDGVVPTTVKKWENLTIATRNEVPAPVGRTEEGELTLELLSDNSLKYDFHLHNLTPGDALTNAHIHYGDAGTSGGVFIDLKPSISGAGATGMVTGLRQGQIDSLQGANVYFNVHSTQLQAGIARVQLDKTVELAMDIQMSGANEVGPVTTTATGLCILRLTSDKMLYSKITVNNIEPADTLRVAHIHRGAAGANGPVRIFLAENINDFGVLKTATLVDSLYNMVKNDAVYCNAHSKNRGSGLVRGQIR